MTHAIRIHEQGGPEKMVWEAVDVPAPGPGEVRLKQTAVGLNYIDTYHRSGLYPLPLPAGIGMAGHVEALGVANQLVGCRGKIVAKSGRLLRVLVNLLPGVEYDPGLSSDATGKVLSEFVFLAFVVHRAPACLFSLCSTRLRYRQIFQP